jgi:hypothetical protein
MILDNPNRKIEIVLAGAVDSAQLEVTASWEDKNGASDVELSKTAVTNDATAVVIVPAPGDGASREINSITVYNSDDTTATPTIRYNDNGTIRRIASVALAAGSALNYSKQGGWTVLTSTGATATTNTSSVALAAVGSTPSANGASLSGSTLTLQPADGTHPGVVTSAAQTIGGNKTFTGTVDSIGFAVPEGSNKKQGTTTLVSGTKVVSNTSVTANSRIFLTVQSLGTVTVPSALAVSARVASTSFTILASDLTDTSVVAYEIFEPG